MLPLAFYVWSLLTYLNFTSLKPHLKKILERFHLELKQYILTFLDLTLMAQWKSGNTIILHSNTDTLLDMLIKFLTTVTNSLKGISSYIDQASPEARWLWYKRFRSERENIEKLDELIKDRNSHLAG